MKIRIKTLLILIFLTIICPYGQAETEKKAENGENASNPLAAVNNTDLRWQYFDLDGPERNDYSIDGSYMIHPKLKLKYELHYWDTDVIGSSESDWESLILKAIYFPMQGEWGTAKYRLALGLEWILDFDNAGVAFFFPVDRHAYATGSSGVNKIPLSEFYLSLEDLTSLDLSIYLQLIAIVILQIVFINCIFPLKKIWRYAKLKFRQK